MNKIIIMTGDLATGKSTFAEILAKKYSIEMKSKDKLKEYLADTIGFSNREENKKLSDMAVRQQIDAFKECIKQNKALIVEANFKNHELQELYEIAEENNYDTLTLFFTADLKVLYDRFNYRIQFGNRHRAHIHDELNTFEGFEKMLMDRRKLVFKSNLINIDATTFDYQIDPSLLASIDKFIFNS